MSSLVLCFANDWISAKDFNRFLIEMSLIFTMAGCILFWELFVSFWTEVSGIRAQSPATNEQPWGKLYKTYSETKLRCTLK